MRLIRAVVLLTVCGGAWMPWFHAWAQSLPLPGSVRVTITSPPSGAHVHSATTVTAEVSGVGSGSVAGVQFKLDGISLGTEDTTAPYAVSWDTTSASEGWHTLTALARDAGGGQSSSEPVKVTVSNSPPPAAPVTRYEETDASVIYSAGWTQASSYPWSSGGTSAYTRTPGARATFTFTGTSVSWIGHRGGSGGIARVFVDGVFVSDVDLFAKSGDFRVPVFTMTGLTHESHTLTIEMTGRKNQDSLATGQLDTVVAVDAFDVPAAPVSRLQDTDPAIAYTAGWAAGQDLGKTDWSALNATVSSAPGAQATLTFSGTSISWIGYRGPDTGTARVSLDGGLAREIDTYSPVQRVQDSIFTATGLADASHTLTIEVTGLKNDASTGTLIAVDAFDVTSTGTRFQETDWSVAYSGNWKQNNRNHPWSEGSVAVSNTPGSQVTFTFTGTSVSWIGRRGPSDAIARVYLDGVFAAELDNYAPTHGYQNTVFTASGLADTSHTLTIEVTGLKNAASTREWPWVVVDAFDVRRPAQAQAPAAPPPSSSTRSEESAASYTGTWTSFGPETGTFSGGTVLASKQAGATATFGFSGTAVTWIGVKCSGCGIATVSIDGGAPATVNTAGPAGSNFSSEPVFSTWGLDPAVTHTMVITVTGTTTSGDAHIAVDAFDVVTR